MKKHKKEASKGNTKRIILVMTNSLSKTHIEKWGRDAKQTFKKNLNLQDFKRFKDFYNEGYFHWIHSGSRCCFYPRKNIFLVQKNRNNNNKKTQKHVKIILCLKGKEELTLVTFCIRMISFLSCSSTSRLLFSKPGWIPGSLEQVSLEIYFIFVRIFIYFSTFFCFKYF